MKLEHLEVLVEEPSMEAFLRVVLPHVLGDVSFQIYQHGSKNRLFNDLPGRLRAYSKMLPASWKILVLVDRDNDDCKQLKRQLDEIAADSGLVSKSQVSNDSFQVINRVVAEELEAWYFGDWMAVRMAYPKVDKNLPARAKYRNPDAITGGTWEEFERVMQQHGYFSTGVRKIEAARNIAQHCDPERNTSASFRSVMNALSSIVT